jgi:ribosomal protein S11
MQGHNVIKEFVKIKVINIMLKLNKKDLKGKLIKKVNKKNYKKNFFFGTRLDIIMAKMYLRRSYTNIFLTLTDLNDKVITCITSGISDKTLQNKRRKKLAQTVEKIITVFKHIFDFYGIKYIQIVLKIKAKAHLYTLINRLNFYGLKILSITSRRLIAHNGIKGRRLRRL